MSKCWEMTSSVEKTACSPCLHVYQHLCFLTEPRLLPGLLNCLASVWISFGPFSITQVLHVEMVLSFTDARHKHTCKNIRNNGLNRFDDYCESLWAMIWPDRVTWFNSFALKMPRQCTVESGSQTTFWFLMFLISNGSEETSSEEQPQDSHMSVLQKTMNWLEAFADFFGCTILEKVLKKYSGIACCSQDELPIVL